MVRLQPYNYERFVQADHLEFSFGGGEANVAVSLANYGLDAVYVTKLPAHAIGQAAVNSLRRCGVDTSMIVRGGDRIGIYYNEKGASQRGSVCIYDRAHSAIQESTPSDFDWDVIFKGADWFHFTGITPALGVARQFFCETRTEFLRKNSPVLRSKSETRSLASTAPKMEGAAHVKGRVLAWGGAAFAAPPLAFCPWGSSYPSVASPASSAASWAATGSVYSDQP